MSAKFGLTTKLLLFGICLLFLDAAVGKPPAESKDVTTAIVNKKSDEFPEEDTDMLMEPNDFTPITMMRSQEHHFHAAPTHQFQPLVSPQIAARSDANDGDSHSQAAQNFYPPFFREAPPLGHSRPYFPTPDGPIVPKFASPLPEAANGPAPARAYDASLLGSGDFGVIRGGTFYPEDETPYHPEENSDFNQFYGDANNGHGRPSGEGFIQTYTYPEEQFANFRDFADINTPADSAFSQYVVVYAAKNSTHPSTHPRPKNIFEQLELLDREKALEEKKQRSSKSKSKLAKTKLQKKYKKKSSPKDLDFEPLLALS